MPNEPDIVQKLSADFNVVNDLAVNFVAAPESIELRDSNKIIESDLNFTKPVDANFGSATKPLELDFGTVYVVSGDCKVLYASTATWNSKPQLISAKGYIYIYSDYRQNLQGDNIASMKVGDGTSYLIDMPFTDDLLYAHVEDNVRHITAEERDFWNNKVRCYIDPLNSQNLIFTTN
jgi:hypothetical protein